VNFPQEFPRREAIVRDNRWKSILTDCSTLTFNNIVDEQIATISRSGSVSRIVHRFGDLVFVEG
jgi:hypothetical protein